MHALPNTVAEPHVFTGCQHPFIEKLYTVATLIFFFKCVYVLHIDTLWLRRGFTILYSDPLSENPSSAASLVYDLQFLWLL